MADLIMFLIFKSVLQKSLDFYQGLVVWPWEFWAAVFFRPFGHRAGVCCFFFHFKPHLTMNGQNKWAKRQIAQLFTNALGCGQGFSSKMFFFGRRCDGGFVAFRNILTRSLRVRSAQALWAVFVKSLVMMSPMIAASHQQGSFFMLLCARHVP